MAHPLRRRKNGLSGRRRNVWRVGLCGEVESDAPHILDSEIDFDTGAGSATLALNGVILQTTWTVRGNEPDCSRQNIKAAGAVAKYLR